LLNHNGSIEIGFVEWIFYPGMLFNDTYKWWGDGGISQRPHKGLDLCFYRDSDRCIHNLTEKVKIAVIYY
jgi:hypothetical protein